MTLASNTPIQFVPSIGWRTAQVLQKLGIYTIGQFTHVPTEMLVELFGPSITQVTRHVRVSAQ